MHSPNLCYADVKKKNLDIQWDYFLQKCCKYLSNRVIYMHVISNTDWSEFLTDMQCENEKNKNM